ncbi:MAG TPA: hypothetical protein VG206_26685 [Terriglobia bacterium]|nr:hypothetical protein [Terriglobia bacterium]
MEHILLTELAAVGFGLPQRLTDALKSKFNCYHEIVSLLAIWVAWPDMDLEQMEGIVQAEFDSEEREGGAESIFFLEQGREPSPRELWNHLRKEDEWLESLNREFPPTGASPH